MINTEKHFAEIQNNLIFIEISFDFVLVPAGNCPSCAANCPLIALIEIFYDK